MLAVGQAKKLLFDAYTAAGVLDHSGTVTLTVIDPTGAQAVHVVTSTNGHYEYDLTLSIAGFWQWTWSATGGSTLPRVWADAEFVGPSASSHYPVHAWCSNADALRTPALTKIASSVDEELLTRACMAATEYLHNRTWRRFVGFRTVELRPCFPGLWQPMAFWFSWPVWQWAGGTMGGGDTFPTIEGPAEAFGRPLPEIVLPTDVQQVTQVLIDGAVFTSWRLDSGRRLLRTDGGWWPQYQDPTLASTQTNTFAVECIVGERENELARLAAMELSAEFYLMVADPSQCRVPVKATQVTRPGMTVNLQEVTSMVDEKGVVALPLCQVFLSSFGKRRRRIRIYNVDIPESTRRL